MSGEIFNKGTCPLFYLVKNVSQQRARRNMEKDLDKNLSTYSFLSISYF